MNRVSISAIAVLLACSALGQTNPIALWAFDEASGTTALDSSGNNHSCSIIGATRVLGRTNTALSFTGTDFVNLRRQFP